MSTRDSAPLRIGWAMRDFTPDRPVLLDGQFHTRVSQRVNDPVTVTALALDGGEPGAQCIWLSCDLVGVPAEVLAAARARLRDEIPDFDPRFLVAGATHTHTSLVLVEGKYLCRDENVMRPCECARLVVARMVEAAREAWERRAPGGVSGGYGFAVVGHNRRSVFADGSAKMYARIDDPRFLGFEGYENHGVNVLFTWDADRHLTGMVVNLACPAQDTEGESYVSADFWHETRGVLRRRHGPKLFVLPQCAPAGDQSPHPQLAKKLRAHMLDRRGLSERQAIAERIAAAVDEARVGAANEILWNPVLRHVSETCDLPRRLVTNEEYEQARAEIRRMEQETGSPRQHSLLRRNRLVLERYEAQKANPDFPIELHVLRLGETAWASNPFELFLDYGLRMEARSPATQNFLVQLACDYSGYLPTAKAVAAGLHEDDRSRSGFTGNYGAGVASNNVGPEGGRALVERTLRIMRDLWGEE